MEDLQIRKDIDNININIETPHDDSNTNLQLLERDNWGRILNSKTFKIIKDNFISLKSGVNTLLSNIISEFTKINSKTEEIDNNIKIINKSIEDIKTESSKINEERINKLADKTKKNNFNELNTFEKGINSKLINIDNNKFAEVQSETINVGDINKNINIIGKGTKLLYNGREIEIGGGSGGSDGNDKQYILVKTLPEKQIKFNNDNKPYFENDTGYFSGFYQKFTISRASNTFTKNTDNTNNLSTDIIKVGLNSDGTYNNSNIWQIQSNSLMKKFMGIFNIQTHTENILDKYLVGISFKFNVNIEVVNLDAPATRYSVIERLSSEDYYEECEMVTSNKYGKVYLSRLSTTRLYTSPYTDKKGIIAINNFKVDSNTLNLGGTLLDIHFDNETVNKIKNYYNDMTKKFYITFNFKEIKLIKFIENSKGGASSGSGTNSYDFSSAYGIPVIAHTPTYSHLPTFHLYKYNLDKIVEYDYNRLGDIFNGNIYVESDGINGFHNDSKPISFKLFNNEEDKNIIIPCVSNSKSSSFLMKMFEGDKSSIPLDKIYGVSFALDFKLSRRNIDNSQKIFIDKKLNIEMRFKKGTSNNLEQLFTSNEKNITYLVNGLNRSEENNGWIEVLGFYKDGDDSNISDYTRVFMKFKNIGLYNLVSINNGRDIEKFKLFEGLYIQNAKFIFEDLTNLRQFDINTGISNTKILLKI